MTRQRKVILNKLCKASSHPTADELYGVVRRTLPHISLATVYRNLEAMAERGIIRKLHISGTQKRFDWNTSRHYHARCVQCGAVMDVCIDVPADLEACAEQATGFRIQNHELEFVGICPECCEKQQTLAKEQKP